jgi:hypothetical protein
MEESKDLIVGYKIFRSLVYVSLILEFFIYAVGQNQDFEVDLTQFGYRADEAVPVYDIWGLKSVGTATGSLRATVPSHGVKLFRLGDNEPSGIKNVKSKASRSAATQQYYDLQGRPVAVPSKGIYIQNGKKYVRE